MTPEAQRVAIAEACGWTAVHLNGHHIEWVGTNPATGKSGFLPDYLADLNACHEMEKAIPSREAMRDYLNHLEATTTADEQGDWVWCMWLGVRATAPQRCEAFLRTLNLWTGGPND